MKKSFFRVLATFFLILISLIGFSISTSADTVTPLMSDEPGPGTGGGIVIRPVLPSAYYSSISRAPLYPANFSSVSKTNYTVNNKPLLADLRIVQPGEWKKVYHDGYSGSNKVSIHYFQHKNTGTVFDVKVKNYWSNQ